MRTHRTEAVPAPGPGRPVGTVKMAILCAAFAVVALLHLAAIAHAQDRPPSITGPTSYADCERFDHVWSEYSDKVENLHQQCLDDYVAYPKDYSGTDPDSPICSHCQCQRLHDLRRQVKEEWPRSVAACREQVRQYQSARSGAPAPDGLVPAAPPAYHPHLPHRPDDSTAAIGDRD